MNQYWPDSLTHICHTRGSWVNFLKSPYPYATFMETHESPMRVVSVSRVGNCYCCETKQQVHRPTGQWTWSHTIENCPSITKNNKKLFRGLLKVTRKSTWAIQSDIECELPSMFSLPLGTSNIVHFSSQSRNKLRLCKECHYRNVTWVVASEFTGNLIIYSTACWVMWNLTVTSELTSKTPVLWRAFPWNHIVMWESCGTGQRSVSKYHKIN